ncbi:MAG: MucR family transcriptional regulator [Thermodesulfobacteriota bacterium]|nr:MucR family transcriptional regulator [Thermodesulfobacteriota bacterium]
MEDHLKEALEIVKAQAGVRTMTEEEITSMVQKLAEGIKNVVEGGVTEEAQRPAVDPKKAIREKSIINLEDGRPYKILTKKNLARFGLTPDEYRAKWGYKKGTPLICKGLQRERRRKMKDMRLWEKRTKKKKK